MKMLSGREIQVIKYTARGYTAKEIAKIVGLDHRTIEIYVGKIRKKLVAKNIAHAIYIASQLHMLNDLSCLSERSEESRT